MSSRNLRLSESERGKAIVFFNSFLVARESIKSGMKISDVKKQVKKMCEAEEGVLLDYFEVADCENLILLESVKEPDQSIMLIAGFVGDVRLIDNMMVEQR
jgi:pantoate--beta-alanine ligase